MTVLKRDKNVGRQTGYLQALVAALSAQRFVLRHGRDEL